MRELNILHHACTKMYQAGLKKAELDIIAYCNEKQKAYESKVHAANLEERIPKAEGVEEQK